MRKQEHTVENKTLSEIAHGLVDEVRAAGKDVVSFIADSVKEREQKDGGSRRGRAVNDGKFIYLFSPLIWSLSH
jgi:hypothetical protein